MGEVTDRCWARAQGRGAWQVDGKKPWNWVSDGGDGDSGAAHVSHGERPVGTVLLE